MTDEQRQMINSLRDDGFAVVVFNPEEVGTAVTSHMQDLMVERGWEYLATYGSEPSPT